MFIAISGNIGAGKSTLTRRLADHYGYRADWLWQGNAYLGLVAGGALAINTVVAVSLGGVIPLFLKKMNVDPALASGPILTTVTDMLGFFLALTFVGLMLDKL